VNHNDSNSTPPTGLDQQLAETLDLIDHAVAQVTPADVEDRLHHTLTAAGHLQGGDWSCPLNQPSVDVLGLSCTARTVPPLSLVLDALIAAGRLDTTISVTRDLLARPLPAAMVADLRCRLGEALYFTGRTDQSAAAVAPVVDDQAVPKNLRNRARALSLLALSAYDVHNAATAAQRVLLAPPNAYGDPGRIVAATVLSYANLEAGDLQEGLRLARAASDLIDDTTPVIVHAYAELALAAVMHCTGNWDGAASLLDRTAREMERRGLEPHSTWATIVRARQLIRAGQLAEARDIATAAAQTAKRIGADLLVSQAATVLTLLALRVGQPLDIPVGGWVTARHRGSGPGSVPYRWLSLLATETSQGARASAEMIDGPDDELVVGSSLHLHEPGAAAWLVRLARAAGDARLCDAVVRAARDRACRNPDIRTVTVAALHAGALANGDAQSLAQAEREHTDPWAAAWAAEDAGRCIAKHAGSTPAVIEHLETALRRFSLIGAERDATRVLRCLKAMGVRHRRDPRTTDRQDSWASLTDKQRAIAYLAAQGMTNRQVAARVHLSPHTINYHLRQVFRKLDVRSRIELARLAPTQPTGDGRLFI